MFRHFILGLLTQQPMSGYDVKRLLEDLSWLIDGPSFGNIYSTLHALLEDDLASVEVISNQNRPSRKVYSITEKGRQALQDWTSQESVSDFSLKAFVMHLILASNFSQARLVTHLERRHAQVAAHLAELESAQATDGETPSRRLVSDYGMALATTELAWLDSTLDRLSQQPLPTEVAQGN